MRALMDARRLVGASMSARKRAAQRDAVSAEKDGRCVSRKPAVRRHLLAVFHALQHPEEREIARGGRARYVEARLLLRIGERLRPCPYCKGPEWIEEMRCPAVSRTWLIAPKVPPCDGSGVLPARRGRR